MRRTLPALGAVALAALLFATPLAQAPAPVFGGIVGGQVAPPPVPSPQAAQQRQLRTGTSRIAGRIVTNTGQPLRQAMVRATATELNGTKTTATDQDGRYEFSGLPAGRYTVSASKVNYLSLNYGQARPGDIGRTIALADNQRLDRIDITVPRGGVIAGRVLDEYGEPATDVQVIPMQKRMSQGQLRLMPSGRNATTNDIGEFRIFGLPPGQYFVSSVLRTGTVPEPGNPLPGYAPTYYPGATTPAGAQAITIGLGETITGIEMQLQTTSLASISGTTLDSQGAPLTRGSVSAILRDGTNTSSVGAPVRNDGTFLLTGVAPGEYLLRAVVPPPPPVPPVPGAQSGTNSPSERLTQVRQAPPETLMAVVTVNGSDVSGVVLMPMKRVTISGRVTFGGASSANLRSNMIQLSISPRSPEASMGMMQPTPVRDDFSIEFVAPAAELVIRATVGNPQWAVKAIRISGIDVTDVGVDLRGGRDVDGLEVELTNRPAEVSGSVTDARGEPQPVPVLIFPQERERWIFDSRLIATARPDQTGRYRLRTLPPGRYLAAVIDSSILASALQDPDVLEGLRSRATPFTLAEGEIKTLDLKVPAAR